MNLRSYQDLRDSVDSYSRDLLDTLDRQFGELELARLPTGEWIVQLKVAVQGVTLMPVGANGPTLVAAAERMIRLTRDLHQETD